VACTDLKIFAKFTKRTSVYLISYFSILFFSFHSLLVNAPVTLPCSGGPSLLRQPPPSPAPVAPSSDPAAAGRCPTDCRSSLLWRRPPILRQHPPLLRRPPPSPTPAADLPCSGRHPPLLRPPRAPAPTARAPLPALRPCSSPRSGRAPPRALAVGLSSSAGHAWPLFWPSASPPPPATVDSSERGRRRR
jgi:hypothetical protein